MKSVCTYVLSRTEKFAERTTDILLAVVILYVALECRSVLVDLLTLWAHQRSFWSCRCVSNNSRFAPSLLPIMRDIAPVIERRCGPKGSRRQKARQKASLEQANQPSVEKPANQPVSGNKPPKTAEAQAMDGNDEPEAMDIDTDAPQQPKKKILGMEEAMDFDDFEFTPS